MFKPRLLFMLQRDAGGECFFVFSSPACSGPRAYSRPLTNSSGCISNMISEPIDVNDSKKETEKSTYIKGSVPWERKVPDGFWNDPSNQRAYMDWLGDRLSFKNLEDWYKISERDFRNNKGRGLLEKKFKGSPSLAVTTVYPDHHWQPWRFTWVEKGFWESRENQRKFLDSIGVAIGVRDGDMSPWYNVDKTTFRKLSGGQKKLVALYNDSIYAMLKAIYPEYDWVPWRFKMLPITTSQDKEAVEKAIQYVEEACQIMTDEDWYKVSESKLRELGVFGLINGLGGLYETLKTYRPELSLEEEKFPGVRLTGEKAVEASLRRLFPNNDIFKDYELSEGSTASFYLPQLKLLIDYQSHHYYGISAETAPTEIELIHDRRKEASAAAQGLTLVSVPFWWDGEIGSLAMTIVTLNPHLSQEIDPKVCENAKPMARRARLKKGNKF